MPDLQSAPLTPDRWDDFETLFGPQGACYGCWCTYFRIPAAARKVMDGAAKRAFMRDRVLAGPPPGVLAYSGGEPVGWVQVGPRADTPNWNSSRSVSRPLDESDAADPEIWAITCFFVATRRRGQGLSHGLLAAAIAFAAAGGARLVEACPIDRAKQLRSVGLYVGPTGVFTASGFHEIARRKDGRPLMRLEVGAR